MARPRTDIRDRVLAAARERFLSDGVDGASLRKIAREAGTSLGMIYYYYPTKDELFFAIIEQVYDGLLTGLAEALRPDVAVPDRIRRLYHRIGEMSDDESSVVRMVVRDVLICSERVPRLRDRFMRGHVPLIMGTVADGMSDGTFDSSRHPLVLFMCLLALGGPPQLLGKLIGERLGGLPEGLRLADELAEALLYGIAPPRGERSSR
jgi:AcrR family transcriptional regulator